MRPPMRATTSATAMPPSWSRSRRLVRAWRRISSDCCACSASRAARLASRNSASSGASRGTTAARDVQRRLQGGPAQQRRRLAVEVGPGRGGVTEPADHDQLAAVVLDPLPQPRPLPDQCLVGHLDGRRPGLRVHVEREQPGGSPAVDDLRRSRPAPRGSRAGGSARRRRPPRRGARRARAPAAGRCRRARGRAASARVAIAPSIPPIARYAASDSVPSAAALGELVEDELQRRQRGGLVGERADQLGSQGALDRAADTPRRLDDGRLDLCRQHRRDRHGRLLDQRAERLDTQGPVEVVGPQRRHHAQPAVRDGQRMREGLEERPLLGLRRQREQLLELVDHQQQLATLGDHLPQGAVDAVGGRELLAPARRCRRPRSCSGSAPAP